MTDPASERRIRAVLAFMPADVTPEAAARREARVRATLREAARGRDHQAEWPEPEGGFGLARDLPCLAAAIRGAA